MTGELATYRDYLDQFRGTLRRQCADLSPEQLATRAVPPSSLSLLGLVRHLAFAEWDRQVARADEWLAGQDDAGMALDVVYNRDGATTTVRDILVHMVEEYARHCGHADLLRECIDGLTDA